MTAADRSALMIAAGAALGLYLVTRLQAAGAVVGTKLNPASRENLIYDDVIGGLGRSVSGDSSWSLGGWLYDLTHPTETATAPTPTPAPALNPSPSVYGSMDYLP